MDNIKINIRNWILVFFGLLLLITLFALKNSAIYTVNISLISTLFIFLFSILLIIFSVRKIDDNRIALLVVASYFILLMLLVVDRYIYCLDDTDPDGFYNSALLLLGGQKSNYGGFYTIFLSYIFKIVGPQRIFAQYLNIIFVIFTEIIFYKTLKLFSFNKKVVTISMLFLCFSPHFLIVAAVLRREALIVFMLSTSLYFFVKSLLVKKINIIFAILFSIMACLFHSGVIVISIIYITFFLLYDKDKKNIAINFKNIFIGIICIAIGVALFFFFDEYLLSKFSKIESATDIFTASNKAIRGGSAYSINISFGNTFLDLIFVTPIRIFYFLFSPLPWSWRGIGDIIAFIFSSIFYGGGLIYSFIRLFSKNISREKKIYLLIFVITLFFSYAVFSWGVSNSGTALRHRDKFIVFNIIMIALALRLGNNNSEVSQNDNR